MKCTRVLSNHDRRTHSVEKLTFLRAVRDVSRGYLANVKVFSRILSSSTRRETRERERERFNYETISLGFFRGYKVTGVSEVVDERLVYGLLVPREILIARHAEHSPRRWSSLREKFDSRTLREGRRLWEFDHQELSSGLTSLLSQWSVMLRDAARVQPAAS